MQTLKYSEALIRRAITRAILRLLGPPFFAVLALLAAFVALELLHGDRGWLVGAATTVVFLGIVVPIAAIRAHTKVALQKLLEMEDGQAQIEVSSGQLHLSSRLGTLSLPLGRVTSVWCYPEFWVLLSGKSILMTLPLAGIPSEITTDWLSQFRTAGARVA